ncbi:MAG: hypothetical protein Fur0025_09610 [Oscillatoriaceae cyanobacterium]
MLPLGTAAKIGYDTEPKRDGGKRGPGDGGTERMKHRKQIAELASGVDIKSYCFVWLPRNCPNDVPGLDMTPEAASIYGRF